jgi:hypothetical protein
VSAALWSLIDARRVVLRERMDSMFALGMEDIVWAAAITEEFELLRDVALQLHAEAIGSRPTHAEVALRLEGLVDRVRLHLDVRPVDFARVRELLQAGIDLIDEANG